MGTTPLQPWLASEIETMRSLASQPALRNLKITQSYHEVSGAFSAVIGADNVNWCTFATWASKTAGRFIRLEDARPLVDALHASQKFDRAIAALNRALALVHPDARLPDSTLVDLAGRIVAASSAQVAEGNFLVYDELGPLFGRMIGPLDDSAFGAFLDQLRPGETAQGGQDLLRGAFTHYREARIEADPQRKAELILFANAQTGLHEQIRLQPAIAGSLDAPIDETLRDLVRKHHAARFPRLLNRLQPVVDALLHPIVEGVRDAWLEFATHFLMAFRLPDGTLRLGCDVPSPPGAPLFPPALQTIDDPALRALLAQYGAGGPTAKGSGARDWADVHERMQYIFELFRSRQQDPRLFEPPFSPDQSGAIAAGRVPDGDL